MDRYIAGAVIKRLRESKKLTQEELAERLFISAKAVSKWETGQGFPDVSLLEPLAQALGISALELFSGEYIRNKNRASDMARGGLYVCPVCGNVIGAVGEAVISCCGITLPPISPEPAEGEHQISVEKSENEYFVSMEHPMTKEHNISFIAALADNGLSFVKLYPEGNAEASFKISKTRKLFAYCGRHGLFELPLAPKRRTR